MEPRIKIQIDARHEKVNFGKRKEVTYVVPQISNSNIRERFYYAIAHLVWEVQLPQHSTNLVKVIYDSERVSVSFLDYLLLQKGVEFKRLKS
ncbi:MAG: hypothetical protein PWP31_1188 [Clostridia bacterium]|nr:hypothetical protein [Clostridia bacterium]